MLIPSQTAAKMKQVLLFCIFCTVANSHRIPFFLVAKSCKTNDCFISLDNSKCDDFYSHVCTKWTSENKKPPSEPFWNQYSRVKSLIYTNIRNLFETRNDVEKSKSFYEICMSSENRDYGEEFMLLITKFGTWATENDTFEDYNYLEHIVGVTKTLNVFPILKFHVDTDTRNRSKSSLYIESGSFVFPEIFLVDPENHPEQIKTYARWIEETLRAIFANSTERDFRKSAQEIVDFEIQLAQLASHKYDRKLVPVGNLTRIFGGNFERILHFVFENTHVDFTRVERVITRPEFLIKLSEFLKGINQRIIYNYIIWSGIKEMARTVSPKLREINFKVDRDVLGVEQDIPFADECMENTLSFFAGELATPYAGTYLDGAAIAKVRRMAKSVKMEFLQMLENAQWLSGMTKYLLIKRASGVRFDVGYSKNAVDASFLNIHIPKNYFFAMLKMKSVKSNMNFNSLETSNIRWPGHIFEVNAYYNVLQNTIILPVGILHPPFFHPSADPASNYGALGVLIGHELSHTLDFITAIKDSWPKKDLSEFNARSACFKKRYDSYGIDGEFTMNENLADNVGIRASFNALKETGRFDERVFFTKYGQMWCEVYGNENMPIHEEHAPVKFRVLGAVGNFKEFNDAFQCENVRKENQCVLWS